MSIKQALKNPLALVAQGFVAGAIIFWVTSAPEGEPAPAQAAFAETNAEAGSL